MTSPSRLDHLASSLQREVRHAAGARADAGVAAAFDGMTKELNAFADQLEQSAALVAGPSPLEFSPTLVASLAERRAWVEAQAEKVRERVATDPMTVRQGTLWGETRRAISALCNDLNDAIDEAYRRALEPFQGDDREILGSLPPTIPGLAEYRDAIDEFDRVTGSRPAKPEDVTNAAATGRRLQVHRDAVEKQAVPAEFAGQWRRMRTGLPLTEMTDPFAAWLREQGHASSAVVTLRSR